MFLATKLVSLLMFLWSFSSPIYWWNWSFS